MSQRGVNEEPIHCCVEIPVPQEPASQNRRDLELVVQKGRPWSPGRVLRVAFLGGHPTVQRRVEQVARTWEAHAHIYFDFVDADDGDIRIAFGGRTSRSCIGMEARFVDPASPTMHLAYLHPDSPDAAYSRAVLHEFGHALGCVHEHQHPDAGIPWDKEAVYRHYKDELTWSRKTVDAHVFCRFGRSSTNSSAYDPKSIMQYPVDPRLTGGKFSVGWNLELSDMDKQFIREMYPRPRLHPSKPRSETPERGLES